MTGIGGWIDTAESPRPIAEMAAELVRFNREPVRTAVRAGRGLVISGKNLDSRFHEADDLLVAVQGRARFKDRDLALLQEAHGMAHAVAEAYRCHGTRALAMLRGSFAVAIVECGRPRALLAIDRMGVHPLFYEHVKGGLVFSSSMRAMNAIPGADLRIRPQALYDYVHFHVVPGPRTVYASRRRLSPGTYLLWDDGSVRCEPYWEMRFVEDRRRPMVELQREFVSLLRQSVSEAADDGAAGAFLSGGTDSSTVAGMLGQVMGRAASTYSIGFDQPGYDEMGYARIAAQHFGTQHHEYYVTADDVASAIPRIAAIHDQPFGNSSAVPAYYCAMLARDNGIDTLLAGDGGDELFGGNERYATQYLYSLYSDLPRLVRATVEPLVSCLPRSGVAGKLQRYMAHAATPMPARYDIYNLLERLGPASVFTAEFLGTVDRDSPATELCRTYGEARASSLINRMLALDLKLTLADNDLPKVTRSCEMAGTEARFPLLDDPIVEFSAGLRPEQKLRRTRLRYFFKEALRDFLPAEIIEKRKHGFGLPFGPWFEAKPLLREVALSALMDLKPRGIVRPEFIDELVSVHMKAHPAYYGSMVWVLMMLEQWLKQHPARLA